ncbi:MAG: hypothetical protein AAGC95_10265 [Pseudomonadota bacterium]
MTRLNAFTAICCLSFITLAHAAEDSIARYGERYISKPLNNHQIVISTLKRASFHRFHTTCFRPSFTLIFFTKSASTFARHAQGRFAGGADDRFAVRTLPKQRPGGIGDGLAKSHQTQTAPGVMRSGEPFFAQVIGVKFTGSVMMNLAQKSRVNLNVSPKDRPQKDQLSTHRDFLMHGLKI